MAQDEMSGVVVEEVVCNPSYHLWRWEGWPADSTAIERWCARCGVREPMEPICLQKQRLQALDTDHFWFDGVLIDLVQLRYARDSLNETQRGAKWQAGGRDIHNRNAALNMLDYYAGKMAEGVFGLATPDNVAKYVHMANQHGLATGWKEPT